MGIDWKNIVPCTSSSPNLFILKEVGVDEHVEVLGVAEGRHAPIGLGNPSARCEGKLPGPVLSTESGGDEHT